MTAAGHRRSIITALLLSAVLVAGSLCAPGLFGGRAEAAPQGGAGTVVSYTDITDGPDTLIAGSSRVISMMYLSEDSNGDLIPVKGSVFIPAEPPKPGGYRTYSWAHGTYGVGPECGRVEKLGISNHFDSRFGPWLQDGYILTATEYAGMGGPGDHVYLDGPTAGRNVIDAVRAARTIVEQETGEKVSTGYIAGGGSQGGHSTLWAAREAPTYAPELDMIGAAPSAPPLNIADYFATLRPGFPPVAVPEYATFFSYVLNGVDRARPDVDVASYLTPAGRDLLERSSTDCYVAMTEASDHIPVGDLIARPLSDGPLIGALRELTEVPTTGFEVPILLQQGAFDIVAFAPLTAAWVEQARADGADIDYRPDPSGHILGPEAEINALRWVNAKQWPA